MSQSHKNRSTATLVTRLGENADTAVGALSTPVWRASTIAFPDFETYRDAENDIEHGKVTYGLHGLPTVTDIAAAVAELEGAAGAVAVPSGLAATTLPILSLCSAGDHLLVVDNVYSPTRRFCEHTMKRLGVEVDYYDPTIGAGIEDLLKPNTRLVFCESPGSLTFEMQDIPAIAAVCRQHRVLTALDNTWATPLGFRAFDHGIDVSIHAATKFICGHSDMLLGIVNCNAATLPLVRRQWTDMGITPSPDDCFLALRGLRTMALRLKQHEKNAWEIANWLRARRDVEAVLYPALEGAPGHELWKRDYSLASGVFSFVLAETRPEKIAAFFNALKLFKMGWSWGGYTSLITYFNAKELHPITRWPYAGTGIRLAIGLEDVSDLLADLENAFAAL